MSFIGTIMGWIFKIPTTIIAFIGAVNLFMELINSYREEKVDKISFIGNFIILLISFIANMTMVLFDNYYTQDTDAMINIILLCIGIAVAVINFVRFVMDKNFILKFYLKYIGVSLATNIICGMLLRFVLSFILYRISMIAFVFITLIIGEIRTGILSSGYLSYRLKSYRYVTENRGE